MTSPAPVQASKPFFGQPELERHIRSALATQRLPRVVLFSGPPALGKSKAAQWMVTFDFCTAKSRPCLSCPDCRAVTANSHPEAFVLVASASSAIGVDDVRLMLERFSTIGLRRSRWLVIREAHQLTEEAANTLLKFLEELPSGLRVVMTTSSLDTLPSTLRSRATVYYWHLAKAEDLRRAIPASSAGRFALSRTAGRPDWLQSQANSPDAPLHEQQRIELILQGFLQGTTAIPSGPSATQRQRIQDQLNFEELIVRELLLAAEQSTGRSLWPQHQAEFVQTATALGPTRLRALADRYLDRSTLSANIQPRLIYADLHLA